MGLEEVNAGVGGDSPSTAWNKVITNFQDVDAHDHTTGNGAKITVGALNINADLPLNNNSVVDVVSAIFVNQPSPLTTSFGLYVENGDLVYRSSTQKVPITANGNSLAVVSSPGSISGMSAPQSVSYNSGSYRFFQNLNIYGLLQSGGLSITSDTTPNPTNFVTLKANPTTGYNLTLPAADPDTNKVLWSSNGAGDLIWVDGLKKSGTVAANQIMLATSATDITGLTVANNQIILGTAGTPVSGQLTNAYVSASAAIAGTKIAPAFGSQNISTTGTISTGAATVGSLTSSGAISGTNLTASGSAISFSNSLGTFTVAPATTFNNNVAISGSNGLTVGGGLSVGGVSALNGAIGSNLTPDGNNTRNLGSGSNRWIGHFTSINANSTVTLSGQSVFSGTVSSAFNPTTNNTYDFGTSGTRWRSAFFSGTVTTGAVAAGTITTSSTIAATGNITSSAAITATGTITGGNVTSSNVVQGGDHLFIQGVNNASYGQGSIVAWNSPSTSGRTNFINNRGGGAGGFIWYNSNSSTGNPTVSGNYTQLAFLNEAGDLSLTRDLGARQVNIQQTLRVNTSNITGVGIQLSDDGDIVDLNDSYCAMRFTGGVRVHSGNKGGSPVITLGSDGVISAAKMQLGGAGASFRMREFQTTLPGTIGSHLVFIAAGPVVHVSGFYEAGGDWFAIPTVWEDANREQIRSGISLTIAQLPLHFTGITGGTQIYITNNANTARSLRLFIASI
jgi:hypothetical protein